VAGGKHLGTLYYKEQKKLESKKGKKKNYSINIFQVRSLRFMMTC